MHPIDLAPVSSVPAAATRLPAQRGQQASRLPLLPLVGAAVLLLLGVFLGVVAWAWRPSLGHHAHLTAQMDATAVVCAVELFHAQAPGAPCPSVEDLVHADILSSSTRTVDRGAEPFASAAWGNETSRSRPLDPMGGSAPATTSSSEVTCTG